MFILASSLVLSVHYSYAGTGLLVLPYKIKVTFDSISIHNDREGTFSGDGEFDLYAYVQGKKIGLTDATSGYVCQGVTGAYTCTGLWDAHQGQMLTFNPGTEVTVDVPSTTPLSVIALGVEVDGCGRLTLPDQISIPPSPGDLYNLLYLDECEVVTQTTNRNDQLGIISKNYDPTGYGAGSHAEKSQGIYDASGDYTLRYTINVTPPPSRQIGNIAPQMLEEVECNNNLPVGSVTSSGSRSTFPPNNAIDNNPSTKWYSTNTLNPFITLNLGSAKSVCSVDIAWADGNMHQYKFDVSVSNDGNTFTNAFTGVSTGTTTSSEKYTFTTPQQAKFVKITITQSTPGSPNSIAQISEIDLFGGDIASSKVIQPDDNLTFSEAEDIQLGTNTTNGSDLVDSVENTTRTTDDGEEGQEQDESGITEEEISEGADDGQDEEETGPGEDGDEAESEDNNENEP